MAYNSYILKKLLLKEHIVDILDALGAHGINPRDSNGIRCSCPIHGSSNATSFAYNPEFHLYNCYSSCDDASKEGDIIKLVQLCQNCSFESSIEFICETAGIDIKLVEDSEEYLLEDTKIKIDNILREIEDEEMIESDNEYQYGVKPIDEEAASKVIGMKDDSDYIENLGFKDSTLELFESGYDSREKRWLLPIRSPEGELLAFDGRTVNNHKIKWKKRGGLLKNLLLGRLDLFRENIEKANKIMLVEGKKDQMSAYEAGFDFCTCLYGSSLSKEQSELIGHMVSDEIIIFPDGDKAGYKMVKSFLKYCYPEFLITVMETPDNEDPGTLSKKFTKHLYDTRLPIEEWLKGYAYRAKEKK